MISSDEKDWLNQNEALHLLTESCEGLGDLEVIVLTFYTNDLSSKSTGHRRQRLY